MLSSSHNKIKDKAWIERHDGQTEVDIANTSYAELPSEWQSENKASAEIVMDEVLRAVKEGVFLDDALVEKIADTLHTNPSSQGRLNRAALSLY